MVFTKNPAKLESRAQGYDARGKPAKALKCRQKIARLTGQSPLGLQNGFQQPLGGFQQGGLLQQQPLGLQQGGFQQGGLLQQQQLGGLQQGGFHQGGLLQQQQLGGLQQGGFQQGGLLQQGGQQQVLLANGPMINAPFGWQTANTPARYEANALKWEKRGNYNKANKNRGKVWRLQNPQYATVQQVPTFYQQERFVGYNQPLPTQQQTQVETIVRPTIVEETLRPERIVEVQPFVHREIDAPQVRVVEKHLYETVPSQGPHTVTNAPIIQETVKPRIIEEVQPVVHREVPAPFVERVEQHVTEHIVQPTVTTKEVINGGALQQQPFVAAGGVPLTQQTTTTSTTTQKTGIMGKVQNAMHHN